MPTSFVLVNINGRGAPARVTSIGIVRQTCRPLFFRTDCTSFARLCSLSSKQAPCIATNHVPRHGYHSSSDGSTGSSPN
ncbi:MAG: hypothetical protein ACTS46_00950 [Candidatus Hodgkinia cicadicola]